MTSTGEAITGQQFESGNGRVTGMPPAIEPIATRAPLTDLEQEGLDYRRRYQGLIGIGSKVPIRDRAILSLVYTPGVAEACLAINEDPLASFDLTCRGNTVAILTDGSDIFGRETGPPEAAIPLEEAKSVIFKTFAGVDAFPLSLATTNPEQIVDVKVVVSGAGVAGIGVARLLTRAGVRDLVVCDRAGALHKYRPERMNWAKAYLAKETNLAGRRGSLAEMLEGADVFIGLSTGGIVGEEMIRSMAPDPIVFALAVPEPEISPAAALAAGAKVVATARSDFPNTMDVSLVFPGVFRGLLDSRARNIRLRTLLYAAQALADVIQPEELHADYIVPRIFDFRVAPAVAAAVVRAALEAGEAGRDIAPELVSERTRRFVYEGRLLPAKPSTRV